MILTYYGHSMFQMRFDSGVAMATDPAEPGVGYPRLPEADVVLVSHGHRDHSYTEGIPAAKAVVDTLGVTAVMGLTVTGLPSFHDEVRGAKRGANRMYIIEGDGLRILHAGDLGAIPDALPGNIDVLLLPVGGFYTIGAAEAAELVSRIAPRIAVAMHYQAGVNDYPISDEREFLRLCGGKKLNTSELRVTDDLRGVFALDFAR